MNDDLYIMWLSGIETIGSKKRITLLEHFGSGEAVFKAGYDDLTNVQGLTRHNIDKILSSRDLRMLIKTEKDMAAKNIRFISINNTEYPSILKEIYDPPIGLYIIGRMPDDRLTKVGVIGARRCTNYGMTVAKSLSKDLAARGLAIISGMARGIDSMAHRGALEGGGQTVAVMGCGVDICYPPENQALRERIIQNGCVISEYPPATSPMPGYFPMRNRIISGLCEGIIVVEAADKSGTLITVEQALDQGREVMVVPGNITSKQSSGTNKLIREGAALVTGYEDVLHALSLNTNGDNADSEGVNNTPVLADEEKLVYDVTGPEPVTVDEIVIKLNSQAHTVNYILTLLEIKGLVQKLPGQGYIRR